MALLLNDLTEIKKIDNQLKSIIGKYNFIINNVNFDDELLLNKENILKPKDFINSLSEIEILLIGEQHFINEQEQFLINLPHWKGPLCFVGHSHIPFVMSYKTNHKPRIEVFIGKDVTIKMLPNVRYMINPGSIGQPRDLNARASFGLIDTKKNTFRLIRVEYNVAAVQKRMKNCGLPEFLYNRLGQGK